MLAGIVALTGALDEHHGLYFAAVGGALDRAAVSCLGKRFQTGLIDHVGGLAIAEFRQVVASYSENPVAWIMAPTFSVA